MYLISNSIASDTLCACVAKMQGEKRRRLLSPRSDIRCHNLNKCLRASIERGLAISVDLVQIVVFNVGALGGHVLPTSPDSEDANNCSMIHRERPVGAGPEVAEPAEAALG